MSRSCTIFRRSSIVAKVIQLSVPVLLYMCVMLSPAMFVTVAFPEMPVVLITVELGDSMLEGVWGEYRVSTMILHIGRIFFEVTRIINGSWLRLNTLLTESRQMVVLTIGGN